MHVGPLHLKMSVTVHLTQYDAASFSCLYSTDKTVQNGVNETYRENTLLNELEYFTCYLFTEDIISV